MEERTISTRRVHEGRLISLRIDEVEREDGQRVTREVVEHPGAVAIVAWDGSRLAMVRQWRLAAGSALLEIPAGTLDPGEEPRATAERELAEEMGIAADEWEAGPSFYTAPGFCTELLSLFLATTLRPSHVVAPDDEAIERSWLTLDEALEAIDSGVIADAKSIAGIYWAARRLTR